MTEGTTIIISHTALPPEFSEPHRIEVGRLASGDIAIAVSDRAVRSSALGIFTKDDIQELVSVLVRLVGLVDGLEDTDLSRSHTSAP